MGEEPAPALNRWKLPERKFWERVAKVVITIAILITIVYIYLLGMQLRYESSATKYFNEAKYSDAAERYLQAYDSAQWGKDRYLYLIALCYKNANDKIRPMDFVIQLAKEYPESPWLEVARESILNGFLGDPTPPDLESHSALATARVAMFKSYKRVLAALKTNRAGASVELTTEYEAYKKYWEAYNRELKRAHVAIENGTPSDKLE